MFSFGDNNVAQTCDNFAVGTGTTVWNTLPLAEPPEKGRRPRVSSSRGDPSNRNLSQFGQYHSKVKLPCELKVLATRWLQLTNRFTRKYQPGRVSNLSRDRYQKQSLYSSRRTCCVFGRAQCGHADLQHHGRGDPMSTKWQITRHVALCALRCGCMKPFHLCCSTRLFSRA